MLSEKAKSRAQQKLFGIVRSYQKGELENPSPEVEKIASTVSKSDVKKMASTKHEGLPEKKKVEEAAFLAGLAKGAMVAAKGAVKQKAKEVVAQKAANVARGAIPQPNRDQQSEESQYEKGKRLGFSGDLKTDAERYRVPRGPGGNPKRIGDKVRSFNDNQPLGQLKVKYGAEKVRDYYKKNKAVGESIVVENSDVEKTEDQAQKKMNQIKKQVLLKKLQAVRSGGGETVTASYQPEGEMSEGILGAASGAVLGGALGGPVGAIAGGALGSKVDVLGKKKSKVTGTGKKKPINHFKAEPKVTRSEGVVDMVKKGLERDKKAKDEKKIKNRKAVPYAALAAETQPEGDQLDELNKAERVAAGQGKRAAKKGDWRKQKAKTGRRNINRFETGTVKRTHSSGGRNPSYKEVTLGNPKPGYGKKDDHYNKNKIVTHKLSAHGTSSATEKGPQKHHSSGIEHHDSAQQQRRHEHQKRRGVKTKGTVAADIKKSLKDDVSIVGKMLARYLPEKKKPSVHDDYYDPMEDPTFDPHEAEATRGQSGRGTKGKMNVRKKYPVKEEVVDETYFDTNRRGISTKGGFVKQYNKPGKLSRASLNHERKSKNPELRMSKKELRKSMEDDANYEKKMGRSKPTPSDLKTALKKQRQSANEQIEILRKIVEARVDAGLSPEEKEKERNIRRFGVSHNVAGHGKLRRALHRSDRGDKKIKGDKSQYVETEAYRVLAKDKTDLGRPAAFSYKDEKDAKKFADSIKSKGGKATVHKEGVLDEGGSHIVDGTYDGKKVSGEYLKLPRKVAKGVKRDSDERHELGKVKDAVTDTLGITNTKRDGVKKPKGVKGFFSMQNSHKPEGEMVEGVMDIVKRYRKKQKSEKKPQMDSTTKKLHKWRKDVEHKEREKYVSPFRPIEDD